MKISNSGTYIYNFLKKISFLFQTKNGKVLGFVSMNATIFAFQYLSMVKDVGTYDTAKFQYIGYTLGVPHTSGYPLYTLLSWIFTNTLRIGEIAWRQNLLNLTFSMVAINFLFFTLRQLKIHFLLSILLTIFHAFTLTFWYISFQAEVYSLHIMFVSMIVYLLVLNTKYDNDNHLYLALCLYGLMFSHHLTSICLFPGMLLYILIKKWRLVQNYKIYLYSFIGILLGLLPYTLIWIRYYAPNDVFVEMHVFDLGSFFDEIAGGKFQTQLNSINWVKLLMAQLPMSYNFFKSGELGILSFFLFFAYTNKSRIPLLIFITLSILFNIYFAISFDVGDPWGYYTPIYYLLVILVGIGIQFSIDWMKEKKPNYSKVFLILIITLLLFRGSVIIKNNSKKIQQFAQKEDYYRSLSNKYVDNLNSNSVFIITSDQAWQTLQYLLQIKNKDKAIVLVPIWFEGETFFSIQEYIDGKEYYDKYFRHTIKQGMPVYIDDSNWVQKFEDYGFRAMKQKNGIYQLFSK